MPSWYLAKSLVTLREQINALYPGRDKESDGSVGDTSHRARKSDHNPNKHGAVRAIDIDEDVRPGSDAMPIVTALVNGRDSRISYIIYEGRMIRSYRAKNGTPPWTWTKYTGPNPHKHHVHISVSPDPELYDDSRSWNLTISTAVPAEKPTDPQVKLGEQPNANVPNPRPPSIIKRGDKGEWVKRVQLALRAQGYELDADGNFGPRTEQAVDAFQQEKGLKPDGKVGPLTLKELGLR